MMVYRLQRTLADEDKFPYDGSFFDETIAEMEQLMAMNSWTRFKKKERQESHNSSVGTTVVAIEARK
jgi:hypothetical protein